jgi:hypothetical protein
VLCNSWLSAVVSSSLCRLWRFGRMLGNKEIVMWAVRVGSSTRHVAKLGSRSACDPLHKNKSVEARYNCHILKPKLFEGFLIWLPAILVYNVETGGYLEKMSALLAGSTFHYITETCKINFWFRPYMRQIGCFVLNFHLKPHLGLEWFLSVQSFIGKTFLNCVHDKRRNSKRQEVNLLVSEQRL